MQVHHVLTVGDHERIVGRAAVVLPAALVGIAERLRGHERADRLDALARGEDAHVADVEDLIAAGTVADASAVGVAGEDAARHLVAGAVGAIEEVIVLIEAEQADVPAEGAVGRGAADFDRSLMVVGRRADAQVRGREAREGAGLDDLVDEARGTGRRHRGGTAAGVDLELLEAKRGLGRGVVVIEGAVNRNTVVLERGVVVVLTANVGRVEGPSDTALRRLDTRNRGHRGVGTVEVASAAKCLRRRGLCRVDAVKIAADARLDERSAAGRRHVRDGPQRLGHRVGDRLRLVGEDRDAGERDTLIAFLRQGERIGIRAKREHHKMTSRIRRRGPGPRGCDCLHLSTSNRSAAGILDRTADVTGNACQCPCSLAEERYE